MTVVPASWNAAVAISMMKGYRSANWSNIAARATGSAGSAGVAKTSRVKPTSWS